MILNKKTIYNVEFMKEKFIIGIIVFLILFSLAIYYFSIPNTIEQNQGSKPEYQALAEDFIQEYLKQEFRPSEINLSLSESQSTGKPYYTAGWRKDDNFQVKVEYNTDGTLSYLTLYIFGFARDISADYFFILPDVELDCFEINQKKFCKSSWVDGENKMDLLVGLTPDDYITYIYLCKMYKESEVYDKICGLV